MKAKTAPGPRGRPLLGNLLDFRRDVLALLLDGRRLFGDVVRFRLGPLLVHLVAHPDGSVAVNTSGNPALAKGGSGDILTGIVAAMLAQFPNDVARAVETAVYLHGVAADFAADALDEHTILATDTLAHLTDAFRYRACDRAFGAAGLTWLTAIQPNSLNSAGKSK